MFDLVFVSMLFLIFFRRLSNNDRLFFITVKLSQICIYFYWLNAENWTISLRGRWSLSFLIGWSFIQIRYKETDI